MTREDLEGVGCEVEGCTCGGSRLVLNARCHPGHGVEARFDKRTGELELCCAKCKHGIARLLVASRGEEVH
jgi:hypothetical protein